ncbi:hypothetical protein [Nocardioides sp. YR527]|uniref:hypothetical protein n=1 Tax=Nocardioides sp. YR527 TaxID=1881028 RepID=UPI00115FB354|nr:hypothetical protein [Nocardioides sp. YR527]
MSAKAAVVGVVVAVGLVSGCSGEAVDAGGAPGAITHRAVAAVALEHLPTDTSSRAASYTDESTPPEQVSVDLRYGADGEYDGDLVSVAVSAQRPEDDACRSELGQHCVDLPTDVKSAEMQLRWTEEEPEEDPGGVGVVLVREGGETASIGYSGPTITGDPRKLEMPISVEKLVAVVEDPRLRYQATSSTLALGEELDDWKGGEPDPDAYERVRNTDHGIAQAYVGGRGGYGYYRGVIRSPLRERFGPEAIGGRLLQRSSPDFTGMPDADIDVLAAPSPPAWMTREPCSAPTLRRHCVTTKGKRGPLVFAWQPATAEDAGWAWMISVREDEVVAVRYRGPRMPAAYDDAAMLTEWYQGEQLDAQGGEAESDFADDLSLWCDREHLEARPVKQLD